MNFNPEFHWQRERKTTLKKRATKTLLIVFVALFVCIFVVRRCHFVSYVSMSLDSSIPENSKSVTHIIDVNKILYKNSYNIKYVEDLKTFLSTIFNTDKSKINLLLSYFGKNVYIVENDDSQSIIANVSNFYIFKNTISSFVKEASTEEFNKHTIYSYNLDLKQNQFFNTTGSGIFVTSLNDYSIVISNNKDEIKKIIEKNQKDGNLNYIKNIKSNLSSYINDKSGVVIKILNYENIDNSKTFIRGLSSIYKNDKSNKLFLGAYISNSGIDINIRNNDFKNEEIDDLFINQPQLSLAYLMIIYIISN